MEYLTAWALLASIQLAATMSPGPAFALSVKNALVFGRGVAMAGAVGLGFGVLVHVVLVLTGVSWLITQSDLAYNIIKYVGAAYLIYIGGKSLWSSLKAFRARKAAQSAGGTYEVDVSSARSEKSWRDALVQGFVTNVFNPKAIVFFASVLSQFIAPDTPVFMKLIYAATCVSTEILWFIVVGFVLTHPALQQRFLAVTHWIDGAFGGMITALGVKIAVG